MKANKKMISNKYLKLLILLSSIVLLQSCATTTKEVKKVHGDLPLIDSKKVIIFFYLYSSGNPTIDSVPFDKICPCISAIIVISSLSKFITFCDLDNALLNFK